MSYRLTGFGKGQRGLVGVVMPPKGLGGDVRAFKQPRLGFGATWTMAMPSSASSSITEIATGTCVPLSEYREEHEG